MLRLVFLGRLEDVAGVSTLEMDLPAPTPLAGVIAGLPEALRAALEGPRTRLALNGVVLAAGEAVLLRDGDELAFLPPVSGG